MLSPELPFVEWILVALFLGVTALLVVRAGRKDRREYQRFKRFRSTVRRQAMYRKWLRESFLVFGGLSAVLLLLVWQFVPLLLDDANSLPIVVDARTAFEDGAPASRIIAAIAVLAFVFVPLLLLFFVKYDGGDVPALGDIQAILPRNRAEVRLGALLSINAGIVEELLFRLTIPSLLFGAFGSSIFAFATAALIFGALHMYQGAIGIVSTMAIGVVLTLLFVATGSILAPIVVHALIDVRSFVAIPLIVLKVKR